MLHPRVPPLVRALPHVESLSLFQAEESQEELETRRKMGVATLSESAPALTQSSASSVPMIVSDPRNPTPVPAATPPVNTPPFSTIPKAQSTSVLAASSSTTYIAQEAQSNLGELVQTLNQQQTESLSVEALASEKLLAESFTSSTPAPVAGPSISSSQTPLPVPLIQHAVMEEDGDELMPGIDMDSDSD